MAFLDMSGRVAVVTGGGRGIGLAVVRRLTGANCSVAVVDVALEDDEVGRSVSKDSGAILAICCDVSDAISVTHMVDRVIAQYGKIDVLINNAGIFSSASPIHEQSDQVWDRTIGVNLTGVFLCSRAVVPHMIERRYGRIVNISSIGAKEGRANMVPYCASKAGVIGLTKALAKELAIYNILVNAVTPAIISTPMIADLDLEAFIKMTPLNRVGRPEEVAAMVHWLCSDEVSFSTGAVFDISGGRAMY